MEKYINYLDMKNEAEMLLATREDLEKCKTKVHDISEHTINMIYAESAEKLGIKPRNAFEQLVKEMKNVEHFQTGDDELDKQLKEEGISSDELVEVSGVSGSGKTYFCLKMVSLALLEKDIAAIYIDTSNYVNQTNVSLVMRNFMNQADQDQKTKKVQEVMGRLKVLKIFELDQLILLLAQILSMLKNRQMNYNLRLIVIDSLSGLFSGITQKNQYYFSLVKELLYYLKSLTKKYFISVVYTNNTKDKHVSRVTELKNLVGEPMTWAVDKQIYAHQTDDQTNYLIIKH